MGEIKVGGEDVLNYASEFLAISQLLEEAYVYCARAENRINEDMYQGKALDEMKLFFRSLSSNTSKLYLLYQKAFQYTQNTYKEFYYNDRQLAQWVIAEICKAGGSN